MKILEHIRKAGVFRLERDLESNTIRITEQMDECNFVLLSYNDFIQLIAELKVIAKNMADQWDEDPDYYTSGPDY